MSDFWVNSTQFSLHQLPQHPRGGGGGGVALPYLAYTGICSWTGYGFQVLEPDILDQAYGLNFQTKKK